MEYFSTFNGVFFFLAAAEVIWISAGILINYVNRKETLEVRSNAGKAYGVVSLGMWAIAFVSAALISFAALTTFFTIATALTVVYGFYLWFSRGDTQDVLKHHIDTMAQDMVDHAHG